ncbi:hypothetical protein Acr_04g0009540 [Actinidia rufa]|uniref:Retrotransposon gag domain-containing protein n=1 Tax=Actinidia rufa TaxID=165716 RepID=A0A7J0EJ35_9ERIC|nr:hypothetical protein Acr_04g0009540 [Actinidia rufa]
MNFAAVAGVASGTTLIMLLEFLQVRRPSTITELVALDPSGGCLSPNPLDRGKTSLWNLAKSSPLSSPEPPSEYSYELAQSQSVVSSSPVGEVQYQGTRAIVTVGCSPGFLPQQFGAVCGNDSSLCTCAAATYPDQVLAAPWIIEHLPWPTLARFQIWKVSITKYMAWPEQMRVMNENNARLIQLLAAANPQPPAAPSVPDVERSRHSNHSGDRSHNVSTERARDRHRAPSPSLRERSSSSESSQTRSRGCSDEVMCKAFSATLKGPARSWFRKLSPGTVDSFGELSRLFVANFMSCRNRQKNASHLFTIHQKEIESLKDFVKRFNQAVLDVEDPSDKVIIMAMMEGLRPAKLTSISPRKSWPRPNAGDERKEDHKRKEPDTRRADYREEMRYKRPDRDSKRSNNRRPRTPPRRPEFNLPPLNTPVAQVLSEIKHEEFIKWPGKIKTDPQKRNRNKYCEFHRDHGHNTEDCFQLKEQIADLIKRGYLRKYITDRPPPNSPERKYGDNRPTARNIQTIHGGFGSGGCSTSSRKRHARSAFRSVEEEVYNLSSPCVSDPPPITFSSDDLRGLHLPHDDALVVSAVIANFNVQRILIDSGSSADILFISAFEKMKIGLDKLHPFHTPLIGFGENTTHPLGWINLPITLGTEPQQTTVWQDFIVVDCPSPYNSILGRTYAGKNQGDHLYLPPEDEIPHLNWNRRSKGRSKGG